MWVSDERLSESLFLVNRKKHVTLFLSIAIHISQVLILKWPLASILTLPLTTVPKFYYFYLLHLCFNSKAE